jgi:agarase
VITVNVYAYAPVREDMEAWHEATGRPILIGEHHVALKSERQYPLRWQVFTEKERYDYYLNYARTWAEMPYSLGCHWYQFADQHLTGRASNGENQIIGFVDITDQPYPQMTKASRNISASMYAWHGVK